MNYIKILFFTIFFLSLIHVGIAEECMDLGYKCINLPRGCAPHYDAFDYACPLGTVCCEDSSTCGDGFCDEWIFGYPEDETNCPEDCLEDCVELGYVCTSPTRGCGLDYEELDYFCAAGTLCCEAVSYCGDDICDTEITFPYPEDEINCPEDCLEDCVELGYKCTSPTRGCGLDYEEFDYFCAAGTLCCEEVSYCGDDICDTEITFPYPEDETNCPEDCFVEKDCVELGYKCTDSVYGCGLSYDILDDYDCDGNEFCCEDITYCGDGICDKDKEPKPEDKENCPEDCNEKDCTDMGYVCTSPIRGCGLDYEYYEEYYCPSNTLCCEAVSHCGDGVCDTEITYPEDEENCPKDCAKEVIICIDSDGEDIYTKGNVTLGDEITYDTCINPIGNILLDNCSQNESCKLKENICEENIAKNLYIKCDEGCEDGKCIITINAPEITKEVQQENIKKNDCSGCRLPDERCASFGTRLRTQYCSKDSTLEKYKPKDMECIDNYECKTNKCINNQCEGTLFQNFFSWISRLFS